MNYIDTNIFIRAITGDDAEKMKNCQAFFQRIADSSISATTTETVIAEITYVLLSTRIGYTLSRTEIVSRVLPLLSLQNLFIQNKDVILHALSIFASTKLDFEDAVLVAYARKEETEGVIFSYDKAFDAVEGIKRSEP